MEKENTEVEKFLTRDGLEIEIGNEYFRENGEVLTVEGLVSGKSVAIVKGYYEGTTMDCRLYPSGYTELELEYEHESEEFTIPCSSLYSEEPVFVITPRIKKKQEELAVIATKIGLAKVELRHVESMAQKQKIRMESELKDIGDAIDLAKAEMADTVKNLSHLITS